MAENAQLVAAALHMLSAQPRALAGGEYVPEYRDGYCLRWVRQAVESAGYGERFERQFRVGSRPTAKLSGQAFKAAGLAVTGGAEPGDLLFKLAGSGGDGHVGILLPDGRVAENSSAHWSASGGRDARGTRSVAAFWGTCPPWARLIVRLPAVVSGHKVHLPGGVSAPYRMIDGAAWAPLRQVAEALGATVVAGDGTIVVRKA